MIPGAGSAVPRSQSSVPTADPDADPHPHGMGNADVGSWGHIWSWAVLSPSSQPKSRWESQAQLVARAVWLVTPGSAGNHQPLTGTIGP